MNKIIAKEICKYVMDYKKLPCKKDIECSEEEFESELMNLIDDNTIYKALDLGQPTNKTISKGTKLNFDEEPKSIYAVNISNFIKL